MSAINAIYAMTKYREDLAMTTQYDIYMSIEANDDGNLRGHLSAWPPEFDPEPHDLGEVEDLDMYHLMAAATVRIRSAGYEWTTDVVDAWEWSPDHGEFRRSATKEPVKNDSPEPESDQITLNGKTYRLVKD